MNEIDPSWTPDAAYRILREKIERFVAGQGNTAWLNSWLLNFKGPDDTPADHPVRAAWRLVLVDVSVFLQCDFPRAFLAESLQGIFEALDAGKAAILTKITSSPCFFELMKAGQIPSPLLTIQEYEEKRLYDAAADQLKGEGFEEV